MKSSLYRLSVRYPRRVVAAMLAMALVLALVAALPSIWPKVFPYLHHVEVDTDPENMLGEDEPVRLFHDEMKRAFALHDMIVVGVVNDEHPDGVFNPESLRRIYELTEYAQSLRGAALGVEGPHAGVVGVEVIAPSTVDNIEQAGPGAVRFEWLMAEPPADEAAALAIRDKARRLPFLDGTLLSEDGAALAIYLPLTSKDLSYRVYSRLEDRISELGGEERWFITGLPVAEDTFGVEMFVQMAVSAPLAMLVIFLLLLFFFRKPVLIISPMIVAMVAVVATMALLVATGNKIHIMSSMIPIFIMPIAVLDSVHILSEFFDRYDAARGRREVISEVMDTLFSPMLFTSLTSAAGFASLALTPIPPVQVFGLFVAFGILLAWLLTITFIPAYIALLGEGSLRNFGLRRDAAGGRQGGSLMSRGLQSLGAMTYRRAGVVVVAAILASVVAAWGISLIEINDNPIRWFRASHPIRVADRVLNEHFGGTYMAYLALLPDGELSVRPTAVAVESLGAPAPPTLPAGLGGEPAAIAAPAGDGSVDPTAASSALEIFKRPDVLRYIERLQAHLLTTGVVGKSNSLTDIVKTVHRELIDGRDESFRVPDSAAAVAQTLVQYQSSHRPGDLYHFVTPDFRSSSIWVQLKSGDNRDMERVVAAVEEFTSAKPPPQGLEPRWFGLTYINVVWQEKMVSGMTGAFLSSFLVVLLMMSVLFRSPLWGLLSMIPLTLTIGLIYGVIGLIGKDYDMPVAVLSSLTLGLAVDFSIHFLVRARDLYRQHGTWQQTLEAVFGEPARAITRNVLVIALGFTPLLAAPLVPYNTVGIFLASILVVSGVSTLVLLPALLRLLEPLFFRALRRNR